jgi:hypothetical protein
MTYFLLAATYVVTGLAVAVAIDASNGGWRLWRTPYWRTGDLLRRMAGCALFWPVVVANVLFCWAVD